jgi:hypothetical protein
MECYKRFAMLYVPLCLIGENGIVGSRIPSNTVYMIGANLVGFVSPTHLFIAINCWF